MNGTFFSVAIAKLALGLVGVVFLVSCSGGPEKLKPAELTANPGLVGVRLAWSSTFGLVDFPLEIKLNETSFAIASSAGLVASINSSTGAELWRTDVAAKISAGVGSDGRYAAVVTRGNELIVIDAGREIWRQKISAQGFTAPFVAGGRVFVLAADRSISAFDAQTGRKLWSQQRQGESLVLRQPGVLLAVGDTLVAGLGSKVVGLNPLTGTSRWETSIATARGTNDIERLVDIVGRVSREGNVVCVRAFQAAVGCVDASIGTLLWTKSADGFLGVHGNSQNVFGVEGDGKVIAWNRQTGDREWVTDRLLHRKLTSPLVVGRSVVVGDDTGLVHFLSREDGAVLTRISTDGSAVAAAPVLAGGTLVVVTRNGGLFGFKPE